jgi:hypothetical protein
MMQKVILIVIRFRIYMYKCAIGTCFFPGQLYHGLLVYWEMRIFDFEILSSLFFLLVFSFSKKKDKEMLLIKGRGCLTVMLRSD